MFFSPYYEYINWSSFLKLLLYSRLQAHACCFTEHYICFKNACEYLFEAWCGHYKIQNCQPPEIKIIAISLALWDPGKSFSWWVLPCYVARCPAEARSLPGKQHSTRQGGRADPVSSVVFEPTCSRTAVGVALGSIQPPRFNLPQIYASKCTGFPP